MPLEAVVVIMDNSEYNRNGDFPPSRWESQQDAANNIIQHKLSSNPENSIGLMSMAGARVDTCLTQTSNDQEIMSVMSQIPISKF
jgi:26S proteasome regulatory subunit N10